MNQQLPFCWAPSRVANKPVPREPRCSWNTKPPPAALRPGEVQPQDGSRGVQRGVATAGCLRKLNVSGGLLVPTTPAACCELHTCCLFPVTIPLACLAGCGGSREDLQGMGEVLAAWVARRG